MNLNIKNIFTIHDLPTDPLFCCTKVPSAFAQQEEQESDGREGVRPQKPLRKTKSRNKELSWHLFI